MSELNNQEEQETQAKSSRISRRSFVRGVGLITAGAVAGVVADRLFEASRDKFPVDELSSADYDRIEQSGHNAREQAKTLQALINATPQTNRPVDILVLDDVLINDKVGDPIWRIHHPILLGPSPEMDDLDKGFWFGVQFPDPGGIDQPPSVGIHAVLFDRRRMGIDYRVHQGETTLAADKVSVLVMPPDPQLPENNVMMVAYEYNQYAPDYRQRRFDDPSQLVAPGLQIAIE